MTRFVKMQSRDRTAEWKVGWCSWDVEAASPSSEWLPTAPVSFRSKQMIIETSIIISRNKKTKVIILRERGSESKTKYINITLLERLTWFQKTPKTFATVGQINYFVLGMKPKKQVIWTTHCKVMVKTGGTHHGLKYCRNLGAMEVWLLKWF